MERAETLATEPLATGPERPEGSRLILGRYRLARRLGSGGFGVVWQARDERLERDVALKVIPREGGDDRIEREARAAARLGHPGIVALFELAADRHEVYLVSELVRGRTLAELERERALSDRDVARVGAALCDALEHAHARGVIHRDVKPQNVMVVDEPAAGAGFAKLADFGVAHVASADPLTRTGDVVGTLAYMAPEQADGARVSPACDVYSLALTLYEAWTGSNPVRGPGPAATAKRLGRPLPPLGRARTDLPAGLCEAIDEALDPAPEARPTPGQLAGALEGAEAQLADEGGLVEPETLARVGLSSIRQRAHSPRAARLLARLGAGAAAGLLVLGALLALGPVPDFSPYAAAALAGVMCAVLPRLAWCVAALACCVWLASSDREGTALLLALALAPVPLLLPRAGLLWSLPALAPLLGTIALAPAFLGIAALAPTPLRRAGLGVAGFVWLAAGELLSGEALLLGTPDGYRGRSSWEDSLSGAAGDAIVPFLGSPELLTVAVWTVFPVLLAIVVRGRFLGLDLLAAAVWATGLAAAQAAVADLALADLPRGAVAGAALGALAAVAAGSLVAREEAPAGAPATPAQGLP